MELLNYNTSGKTSIQDMPDLVKFTIFKKLQSIDSLKNARLVCTQWYSFLQQCNHNLFKLNGTLTATNNSLNVLQSTFQNKLGTLTIKHLLDQILPIVSSTRTKIPLSSHVILRDGISPANILKVLRYYCTSATTTLTLDSMCLLNVGKHPSSLLNFKEPFRLSHLSTLNIICDYLISAVTQPHLTALNEFLQHIQIPCIHTLVIRLNGKLMLSLDHPNPHELGADELHNLVDAALAKFNIINALDKLISSFGSFIKNHGKQIIQFELFLNESQYRQMLNFLQYLHYMEELEDFRCKFDLLFGIDHRPDFITQQVVPVNKAFAEAMKVLVKLKSFQFFTSPYPFLNHQQAFAEVVPRLERFSFHVIEVSTLSWLHSGLVISQLKTLVFQFVTTHNPFNEILNSTSLLRNKLLNLETLKLIIHKPGMEPSPSIVYEDCVNWILQMTPNLKKLQLYFISYPEPLQYRFSLDQMKRILIGLRCLEQLIWNKTQNGFTFSPDPDEDAEIKDLRNFIDNNGLLLSNIRLFINPFMNTFSALDDYYCIYSNKTKGKNYLQKTIV